MKKRFLCIAACVALMITAGCGNGGVADVIQAKEISTSESSDEKPVEQEVSAEQTSSLKSEPITIRVNGQDLVFPTSRDDAEKFMADNGYTVKQNDRVQITGFHEGLHGFLTFDYMDQDPSVCTGVEIQELPIVCGDLVTGENDTYKMIYDKCNVSGSGYLSIYQRDSSMGNELGIIENGADNCYLIKFNGDSIEKFSAFISKDYYDSHGSITRTFTNFEENFLSSTDIEGLYIYSPKEGRTFSTNYFYRDGLNFKLDNALVCTVDTRNPKYDSDRDHFDNIYVGKDENGKIKEIYEAGISESTYANAKAEFEEYCNSYKVSIEPKELLDEVIPELWHKDMIQCLGALLAQNEEMKKNGATFRINKESVAMDYDLDTTNAEFKMTIDEYPDVMILVSTTYEYESSFGMSATGANIIPGKQQFACIGDDNAIAMDQPADISSKFDDFFSTSGNYENLPTTYCIHDYVGYYASGVAESTNMVIEDASGNPVALFLGEHDYSNYKKVPIIEYGDEVNYPGTEMLDGLDFSSGIDSDGKYVYIE